MSSQYMICFRAVQRQGDQTDPVTILSQRQSRSLRQNPSRSNANSNDIVESQSQCFSEINLSVA